MWGPFQALQSCRDTEDRAMWGSVCHREKDVSTVALRPYLMKAYRYTQRTRCLRRLCHLPGASVLNRGVQAKLPVVSEVGWKACRCGSSGHITSMESLPLFSYFPRTFFAHLSFPLPYTLIAQSQFFHYVQNETSNRVSWIPPLHQGSAAC